MVLSDRDFSRLCSNAASPAAQHMRNTHQGAQNNTCRDGCMVGGALSSITENITWDKGWLLHGDNRLNPSFALSPSSDMETSYLP